MAGIIIGEGASKGPNPSLLVLSVGAITSTRQSNDMLPYIPALRGFFSPLPKSAAQMALKAAQVPLSDVEAITDTMIKVPSGPSTWYINTKKGKRPLPTQSNSTLSPT